MTVSFVRTQTVLDQILERKVEHITTCKQRVPLASMIHAARSALPPRDFTAALRRDRVALIAEVKHASPSKGVLIEPFDPVGLAETYMLNGAAAVSVLTDEPFFMGSLAHLMSIRSKVELPLLRKDFVLDSYQVYEGRAAGADAILLIVAALNDTQLTDLHCLIEGLGMAALVEVHNEAELERALRLKPSLIGVNNRDLKTFEVDMNTAARLAKIVPPDTILVAESGIHSGSDVLQMAGARAVLVGEALVKADNIGALVRELSSQPYWREA